MKADRCPGCGSTDVFEMPEPLPNGHDCGCLDCPKTWRNGGQARRGRTRR